MLGGREINDFAQETADIEAQARFNSRGKT